ncbi:MAG: hypothetical protein WCV86_00920 [Patescibacteria group bacterium]
MKLPRTILVLALFVAACFVGCHKADTTAKAQPLSDNILSELQKAGPVEPDTSTSITSEELRIITSMEDALAQLATKSPTAKGLLEFYQQNAMKAHFIDNQTFSVMEVPTSSTPFFIVAEPQPREHGANETYVAVSFDMDSSRMLLHETRFSPLVKGLYFAHELVHAADWLSGNEPLSEPLTPEWLYGEYRAHSITSRVLNEYTKGGWLTLVQESIAARKRVAKEDGQDPTSYILGEVPGDVQLINTLLGTMDLNNMNAMLTQLTVDANMLAIEDRITDPDAAMKTDIHFLHAFYAQAINEMGGS